MVLPNDGPHPPLLPIRSLLNITYPVNPNSASVMSVLDITDAELGLTGYVMFRRDRIGRRGGGVILYVKKSIQAYEIKLERKANYDEAVWCKIVSGN